MRTAFAFLSIAGLSAALASLAGCAEDPYAHRDDDFSRETRADRSDDSAWRHDYYTDRWTGHSTHGDGRFYPGDTDYYHQSSASARYERDTWRGPPEDPNAPKSAAAPQSDSQTQTYDPNPRIVRNEPQTSRRNEPQLTPSRADSLVSLVGWPAESRRAADDMVAKYGMPDEQTDSLLCWNDRGPFKRIAVYREAWDHNFPAPHKDVLEHTVLLRVPPERLDELARFDGSVYVKRTPSEVSARCDREEMNIVALNLAQEIASGERSVSDARNRLASLAKDVQRGDRPAIARSLLFTPGARATAHVDQGDD